jgi:hypothetical protein
MGKARKAGVIICGRGQPTEEDLEAVREFGSLLEQMVRKMVCKKCGLGNVEEGLWWAYRGRWRLGAFCWECIHAVDCEYVELI